MADPKQKSLDMPSSLVRVLPRWVTPMWTEAERWRAVVRNQPVAIIARDKLITFLQSLPHDIRARDLSDAKALKPDINYYEKFILKNFDILIDNLWQDVLDLPIGGNVETMRFPPDVIPSVEINGETFAVTRPWERGHIFKLVNIDGATLAPTHDPQFPIMQRLQGNVTDAVFFTPNEISRILMTPRPEWQMKGFGMPPPQRLFLAITLLFRGDQYYANLLIDTPEAGILDMMDQDQDSATKWVESYRNMFQGIDGFKIGIGYEHQKPWQWIPFGRPPTDLMFNEITEKYARLTAAGYFLSLSDLGLEKGAGTLAGTIRQQRDARLSGFGIVREKTKNWLNDNVIPPYLEFEWIERDEEALLSVGRARLTNAQAMKTMKEAGFITAEEGQEQLKKDGLLTIEVEAPEEPEPQPALPQPAQNGQLPDEDQNRDAQEKVPVSQGGRAAEIQRGPVAGDPTISAAPPGSAKFDQLLGIFQNAFDGMQLRMGNPQLRKLIKAAARLQFPITTKAIMILDNPDDLAKFSEERTNAWFGEKSMFDDIPDVQKIDEQTLKALDELLEKDRWWELPGDLSEQIALILELAFGEGATEAAEMTQQLLYEEGLRTSPDLIGFNFDLKNPATLAQLNGAAATMVTRVNDGTKFFLKRIITSGVDEGLSSPEIALRIQEGQSLDTIFRDSNFTEIVTRDARAQVEGMTNERANSIVNTEIAKSEGLGRVQEWKAMNLTKKAWKHSGSDTPCPFCQANIDLGLVDIDFEYTTVFGEGTALAPPAHPQVDHCAIFFDEDELIAKAGELNVWTGD